MLQKSVALPASGFSAVLSLLDLDTTQPFAFGFDATLTASDVFIVYGTLDAGATDATNATILDEPTGFAGQALPADLMARLGEWPHLLIRHVDGAGTGNFYVSGTATAASSVVSQALPAVGLFSAVLDLRALAPRVRIGTSRQQTIADVFDVYISQDSGASSVAGCVYAGRITGGGGPGSTVSGAGWPFALLYRVAGSTTGNALAAGVSPVAASIPDVGVVGANTTPIWYIDPANSTGLASNANSGTSASTPLLTLAEWSRRLGVQPIDGNSLAAMTVNLMSNSSAATPVYSIGANIINDAYLLFQGARIVLATFTISARTIWDDPTGVIGSYTCTGAPSLAAYVGKMVRVSASATPSNVGLKGALAKDLGSGVFRCNFADQSTGVVAEPSIGDTIQVYDLIKIPSNVEVWSMGSSSPYTAGGTIYFQDLELGQTIDHSVTVLAAQASFIDCIVRGLDVQRTSIYSQATCCATFDFRSYGTTDLYACTHFTAGGNNMDARGGGGIVRVSTRCLVQSGGPTAGNVFEGPGSILAAATLAFADYGTGNADGATAFPGSEILTSSYFFGRDGSGSGASYRVYNGGRILHVSGKGPAQVGTRPTNGSNIAGTVAASAGGTGFVTVSDAIVGTAQIGLYA